MEIMSDERARDMFDTEIGDTDVLEYLFDEIIEFKDMALEEGYFDKLDYD